MNKALVINKNSVNDSYYRKVIDSDSKQTLYTCAPVGPLYSLKISRNDKKHRYGYRKERAPCTSFRISTPPLYGWQLLLQEGPQQHTLPVLFHRLYFFPQWSSPISYIHLTWVCSPLFQGSLYIQSFVFELPDPLLASSHFFFHRLKSVVVRVLSDRDDWPFQYTLTDKVIIPALYSIVVKSVMSYSVGQYSLLWDERASLCDVIFRQSHYYTGFSVKEWRSSNLVRKGGVGHAYCGNIHRKRQRCLYMYIYMYKYIYGTLEQRKVSGDPELYRTLYMYISHCVDI